MLVAQGFACDTASAAAAAGFAGVASAILRRPKKLRNILLTFSLGRGVSSSSHSIWLFGSDGAAAGSPAATSLRSRTSGTSDSRFCLSAAGRGCIGGRGGGGSGTVAEGDGGGEEGGGTRRESDGGAACDVSEKSGQKGERGVGRGHVNEVRLSLGVLAVLPGVPSTNSLIASTERTVDVPFHTLRTAIAVIAPSIIV